MPKIARYEFDVPESCDECRVVYHDNNLDKLICLAARKSWSYYSKLYQRTRADFCPLKIVDASEMTKQERDAIRERCEKANNSDFIGGLCRSSLKDIPSFISRRLLKY